MFVVKSAFWLGLAYVVITHDPGGIATAASSATAQAAATGRQLISTGIAANPCLIAGCAAAPPAPRVEHASPTAVMPTHAPAGLAVPMPRTRPPRLG